MSKLTINKKRLLATAFFGALSCEVFVVLIDIYINRYRWIDFSPIRKIANIAREDSFANWMSSVQFLIVSVVLALITIFEHSKSKGNRRTYRGWAILSAFFLYMAVDDGVKLHERVGSGVHHWINETFGAGVLSFFPTYSWQLILGPFFIAMGIFMAWFLWRELKNRLGGRLFICGLACYAFAVGLDFIEGLISFPYEEIGLVVGLSKKAMIHYAKALEEFTEMFGTTMFLIGFLDRLCDYFPCEIGITTNGEDKGPNGVGEAA